MNHLHDVKKPIFISFFLKPIVNGKDLSVIAPFVKGRGGFIATKNPPLRKEDGKKNPLN